MVFKNFTVLYLPLSFPLYLSFHIHTAKPNYNAFNIHTADEIINQFAEIHELLGKAMRNVSS